MEATPPASKNRLFASVRGCRGRRKYFDIALTVIYIDSAITASGGDIDQDGNIEGNDVDAVLEVAIDAQRRSPLSAIEESRSLQQIYPADDYFRRLHGLGYEEVLALAGGPSVIERYRAAFQTYWAPRQARMRELAMRNRPPPRPPPKGEPMRDPLGRVVN